MPRRLTNLVLLAAVTTLLATGVLTWLSADASAGGIDGIHRIAGVLLVRAERQPALVDLVDRRAVLRGLALLSASLVVSTAFDGVALARRFTGSRHAGSFTGNAMPVTIWAFDDVPAVDVEAWRLRISGSVARPAALSYAELLGM